MTTMTGVKDLESMQQSFVASEQFRYVDQKWRGSEFTHSKKQRV